MTIMVSEEKMYSVLKSSDIWKCTITGQSAKWKLSARIVIPKVVFIKKKRLLWSNV